MSLSSYRRQMPVSSLADLGRQGRGSVGGGGSEVGVQSSLSLRASTVFGTHPFSVLQPQFHQGDSLGEEGSIIVREGSSRAGSFTSPGFYSRIFVVMKASGSWRPVIDLSTLNLRVCKTPFKMETLQSVLLSVRSGDWMVSIDLKDAYLQIPIHPDSRKYLRFVALNQVFQFKALCFGLSTAPQVFTRVMAPVSALLHRQGIRMCRYLDDWLLLASSRPLVLQALETVLQLCQELGIVINWEKSSLTPAQRVVYLGVILDSTRFRASPSQPRVEKLCSTVEEFLSCDRQRASLWRRLLGLLSSLTAIIPGGRLRMRSLQLRLHLLWDQVDDSSLIHVNLGCRLDLEWWVELDRLQLGISLAQVNPHLDFWSDTSDMGWGAHLQDVTAFGRWSQEEALLSINARDLLAVEFGLHEFQHLVSNSTVAIFADNSTALAYFSPFRDPSPIGTDALLQNWDGYQVYAFPPWSMIPLVLKKLRSSSGVLMTLVAPFWPQRPWFPDLLELVVDGPIVLPNCRDLLSQPRFHCHHRGIDKLSLHAWRLSSDLLDPRGSPLE